MGYNLILLIVSDINWKCLPQNNFLGLDPSTQFEASSGQVGRVLASYFLAKLLSAVTHLLLLHTNIIIPGGLSVEVSVSLLSKRSTIGHSLTEKQEIR